MELTMDMRGCFYFDGLVLGSIRIFGVSASAAKNLTKKVKKHDTVANLKGRKPKISLQFEHKLMQHIHNSLWSKSASH